MDRRDVCTILARHAAVLQPRGAIHALEGAGGLSGSRLFRFEAARGPVLLRRWPEDGRTRGEIAQIHRWLSRLRSLGFVPVPFADERGETICFWEGACWQLEPWMPGSPWPADPPEPVLAAALAGLARFHERFGDLQIERCSPGISLRRETVVALLKGGFETLARALESSQAGDDERALARTWLSLAREHAPAVLLALERAAPLRVLLQPCLRDARPEHFLFEHATARLTGLVDFGAMDVDSPACDLARLLLEWGVRPGPGRERALDAYGQVRTLDLPTRGLVSAFEQAAALLIGERWVRWRFVEHRPFPDPRATIEGLSRAVQRVRSIQQLTSA